MRDRKARRAGRAELIAIAIKISHRVRAL
jgi:hypothetical protein